MKVLNFGSLNLDYVYQVERFVQPGETLSAVSQSVNPGGKGLNQSIALARAGAEVYHAGCVGQGGERLGVLLRENGIHTDHLLMVDTLQGNAVIQVNGAGENCIILYGGSNQCVTEEQVRRTLDHFSPGDYLLLQNEINQLPLIVDTAYKLGMKIVLNPSPYNEKLAAVDFGKISWLLVNEVEAEQLSGSMEPEEAWRQLYARYPGLPLLITLGREGSIAFTGTETVRQAAFPAKVVDTTAAGDTYTGYLIAGLAEGRSLSECMRRASMAASISVTWSGAADSIPTQMEVEKRLEDLV